MCVHHVIICMFHPASNSSKPLGCWVLFSPFSVRYRYGNTSFFLCFMQWMPHCWTWEIWVEHGKWMYREWCITFEVLIESASSDFLFSAKRNILHRLVCSGCSLTAKRIFNLWVLHSVVLYTGLFLSIFFHWNEKIFIFSLQNVVVFSHYWKSYGNDGWALSILAYHIYA